MEEKNIIASEEEEQDGYLGNIWGWKFSFISLALILIMAAFAYLQKVNEENAPTIQEEMIEIPKDSMN